MNRRASDSEPTSRPDWFSDPRVIYGGLWLLSTGLQLTVNSDWLTGSARLVDPPADCLLSAGSGWSSPLSQLAEGYVSECPTFLLLFIMAAFLSGIALHLATCVPLWMVAAFLTGSSLTAEPRHLIPAGLICGMNLLIRSRPASAARILLCGAALAALLTIEFGFVTLAAAGLVLDTAGGSSRPRRVLRDTACLAVCGGLALILTDTLHAFLATLLRPLSWSWIPVQAVGLQSTGPVILNGATGLPFALLLLFLIASWFHMLSRFRPAADSAAATPADTMVLQDRHGPLPVWSVLILSLIGLCCGRYFWMCLCCIAATETRQLELTSRFRTAQFLCAVCLTFVLAGGTALLEPEPGSSQRSPAVTDLVDPIDWEIQGNVLLMDLDQSADWQSSRMRSRFRLIADDRWDVSGSEYISYSAICRDLFEVRADSYLRADGRYGGYKQTIRDWSPVLLVTASSQLDRIRQLSLSPHWTTLSIDSRRTVFGRSDDPQIALQRQRAAGTLLAMEWPVQPLDNLNSVILAATDSDLRTVAEVLCAIRLPYAALRALPSDQLQATRKIRTWCFLELAHRARRHSGQASLLHQFRAMSLVREIQTAGQWSAEEQLRIARSLEGLGQFDLALRLCEDASRPSTFGAITDQQRRETDIFSRRLRKKAAASPFEPARNPAPVPGATGATPESRLRIALASGLAAAARDILPELPAQRASLYQLAINSQNLSPAELVDQILPTLQELKSSRIRPDLQRQPDSVQSLVSEAAFWAGCLAIESGNAETARLAFSVSEEFDPHSAFQHLRRLHQQRLR